MTPSEPHASAPPETALEKRSSKQLRALGYLALAAMAALVIIALPVAVGLFLGVLLAFTLQPLYGRLRGRHWSPGAAALVSTAIATVLVAAFAVGFLALLVTRGAALASTLPSLVGAGGSLRRLFEMNVGRLAALHIAPTDLSARIENELVALGSRAAGFAADAAGATFSGLLTLLFTALATYFVLRHWSALVSRAESMLPFAPRHTHALLDQFRSVGRQVLRGTVVTGLVQGLFAGIGFALAGAPEAAFLGALTAVASLVPAVGTMLIFVPVALGLIATDHTGAGTFLLGFGLIVVVVIPDYVIRPRLVRGESGVPAVLTFISLFGGVEVFGLVGLILGPVIVTLSVAVLRTYEIELRAARGT